MEKNQGSDRQQNCFVGACSPPPAEVAKFSPDLAVSFQETISLFHPLTDSARQWMDAHCPGGPDHQYFCGSLVVEARYVESLLEYAQEDGLVVSLNSQR
jgi:hypothetical protein